MFKEVRILPQVAEAGPTQPMDVAGRRLLYDKNRHHPMFMKELACQAKACDALIRHDDI